jgi:NAD(P)-dependent dehydrogenase (short-subunit alcohol dehydrogenase family)
MVNFSLEGKTALVTGASRGIGEAIAMTLADYGAHCILVSRKIEGLEAVVKKITDKGGKADAIACHMGYADRISTLFDDIMERFVKLDILINNAATNPYFGPMIDADALAWDKTFDVNLKGPFFMIQHAARLMKKNGGGAIVNVSSVNAITSAPFQGIYAITKAGLVSMTKTFAKELVGDNIRVNALLPGVTATKMAGVLTEDSELLDLVPMKRAAQPVEMAGAVLYLVSEASSYATGSCLVCDGGVTA